MVSSDSDQDEDPSVYALHNAAEIGDEETLQALIDAVSRAGEEDGVEGLPRALGTQLLPQMLGMRDFRGCTPLHLAILNARVGCAGLLLRSGASPTTKCDGNPPLCMAACVGLLPGQSSAAHALMAALLSAGAAVRTADDGGRTALHWACAAGLANSLPLLLAASRAADEERLASWKRDASALQAMGVAPPPRPDALPHGAEAVDADGLCPLHWACTSGHAGCVEALLRDEGARPEAVIKMRSKDASGLTALHLAACRGRASAASALLRSLTPDAAAAQLGTADRKGRCAADLAQRHGHEALAAALRAYASDPSAPFSADGPPPPGSLGAGAGAHTPTTHTVLLAPDECLAHHTAPSPIERGSAPPPPENVDRLKVLTTPGAGILRTSEFAGLQWVTHGIAAAELSDVLRCHDYPYVKGVEETCAALPTDPSKVGRLDMDTAISHGTYMAALKAAGAVIAGIDAVMESRCANAFCAVRPPGHHAGPSGTVTNTNDANGSHGFCIFSNVAIGAAYAMNVYRRAGIRRVALLDFDVHHGNGTEAVVGNTVPGLKRVAFSTPFSDGVQTFPTWKPWLGSDDGANIMFASVQGYGRGPHGGWFYPGSGKTDDTHGPLRPVPQREASPMSEGDGEREGDGKENGASEAPPHPPPGGRPLGVCEPPEGWAPEDPDGEFEASTSETGGGRGVGADKGPRVINVGVPGPGSRRLMWRRAWRDKILPAVFNFQPDLILVSAGFDAHKKEDINMHFVGVTESDYEWLSHQIVELANRCCAGRLVSVLEGGYNLRGGLVSAFARSVAAHVRALASGNGHRWDEAEGAAEREYEAKRRKAAAQIAAAAAMAAKAVRSVGAGGAAAASPGASSVKAERPAAGGDNSADNMMVQAATVPVEAPAAAAADASDGAPGAKRRRRGGPVDYAMLNAQLEAEAKEGGTGTGAAGAQ
ncbi:hypothetical protein FOA52_001182 [Chlamydomonas sp. UWO 241]|nr:hypothetical protein FOA52_001182 [Chlamydomonas sp. UWO 241]